MPRCQAENIPEARPEIRLLWSRPPRRQDSINKRLKPGIREHCQANLIISIKHPFRLVLTTLESHAKY